MSSSESEEFYDAVDVTPQRNRCSETHKLTSSNDPILSSVSKAGNIQVLSDEERELLQAKQIVEIKRKLEDSVIEQRLREVRDKEAELKERDNIQQSYAREAGVSVQRRKKLEEMRQLIGGDAAQENTYQRQGLCERDSDSDLAKQSQTSIEGEIKSENDLSVRSEVNDNLLNSRLEDIAGNNVSLVTSGSSLLGRSSIQNISEVESVIAMKESDVGVVVEHNKELGVHLAQEPDLIQSVKSSSLGRSRNQPEGQIGAVEDEMEGGVMEGVQMSVPTVAIHRATDELSDVTKMPPPPVVPPRRKKKYTSAESLDQQGESSPPDRLPVPSGPRPGTAFLLTAPSPMVTRRLLDLSDLKHGQAVVTATEAEETRAVNDVARDSVSIYDTESLAESTVLPAEHARSGVREPEGLTDQADGDSGNGNWIGGVVRDSKSHSFPRGHRALSGSGLSPDQQAVLDTVSVLNLDTGQRIPLSLAEEKLPASINPLSLHIMRRTKEYLSDSSLNAHMTEGGEKTDVRKDIDPTISTVKGLEKKKKKLKSLFGKAKNKLKSVKGEVFHKAESSSSDEEEEGDRRFIKIKASKTHKGPYDFDMLVPVQYMEGAHHGAVWTMKFSPCGRLLATGGQDNLLIVWVLKDAYSYFNDMRTKYSDEQKKKGSPAVSEENLQDGEKGDLGSQGSWPDSQEEEWFAPFNKKPFCTYKGHTADILDVSWSKNYFLLTSSMDKTVRLWHVSRKECLCCFQHIDFVTAISFHPKDDRYFLSGSLDGKLRLWSIPERKVELWNEVSGSAKLITAANFCMKGKFAVVGTYDGRCVFYSTEQLKYYTQIHVRSTRGKNSKGRKITGVEPLQGEDKILVTSNDSRVRIYDLRDLTLTCKYKGCLNNSSQIKACFSHDGRFIVCGSEDHFVYIWRTQHDFHKFSSARRDRSDYWEAIKAHTAVVTVSIFAPKPQLVIKNQFEYVDSDDRQSTPEVRGEVLISADYNGTIKCFINKFKPIAT